MTAVRTKYPDRISGMSTSNWISAVLFGLFAIVSVWALRGHLSDQGKKLTVSSALLGFDVLLGVAGAAFVVAGIDGAYWPMLLALLARVAFQHFLDKRSQDAERVQNP